MTEEEIAKIQADQEQKFIQKQKEMLAGQTSNGLAQANKYADAGGAGDGGDDDGATQASARKEMIKILETIKKRDQRVDAWVCHKFENPARLDHKMMLTHWSKKKEMDDPYPFAKFNKKLDIF